MSHPLKVWLLTLTLALARGGSAQPAPARPAAMPTKPTPVVSGAGVQILPSACRLKQGTLLLAFERLQTAHLRRVYVKRRRPGFGWSYARPVTLPAPDVTHRHPTLLCRPGDAVLLYAQAGDIRKRLAGIRVFSSKGDVLRFVDRGRIKLGFPPHATITQPFAAPGPQGSALLTVTRQFAGTRSGCYLAGSSNGIRFTAARRIGPGDRCRTIALDGRRRLITYQLRPRRRQPLRTYFRLSTDQGRTWSPAQRISRSWESFDTHPVAHPDGTATLVYVVATRRRSLIQAVRLDRHGRLGAPRTLSTPPSGRDLTPFGVPGPTGLTLLFSREVRPLDFDILSRLVISPTGQVVPRRPR